MSRFCAAHRLPRAGVDPIDDAATALAVIRLAAQQPPTHETIALVLDGDRIAAGPSSWSTAPSSRTRCSMSSRRSPSRSPRAAATARSSSRQCVPHGGPLDADEDRWLEASDLADDAGVELIEWFVLDGNGGCVEPSRAPRGPTAMGLSVSVSVLDAQPGSVAGRRHAAGAAARGCSTSSAPAATIAGRCSSGMS